MVEKKSLFQRMFSRTAATKAPAEKSLREVVVMEHKAVGSSGTQIFSGYFNEEYLQALSGNDAADVYDKMRRGDGRIKMVLNAVKNPIKGASWEVEAGEKENAEAEKHAAFIKHVLFEDLGGHTWSRKLGEILTMIDFGHSVFEIVHKQVKGHKTFGNYTGIESLGWRSQKTIERWNVDKNNGKLASIEQWTYGDLERTVTIPGEFLVVFTLDQEGDNYEGVSGLRACYGAWWRKDKFLKLNAIGIEKTAVPAPKVMAPANAEKTESFGQMKAALQAYTSHQANYIIYPFGWECDFNQSQYDGSGTRASIDAENMEIVAAFLANFLMLGQTSGSSGSYALSFDLSDFFLSGLEHVAKQICEVINEKVVKPLIDLNFGPQEKYPCLRASGISDKAGSELANALKTLADGKIITPDDPLEVSMRRRFGLPEMSEEGREERVPKVGGFGSGQEEDDEDDEPDPEKSKAPVKKKLSEPVSLASKRASVRKAIDEAETEIYSVMQSNLKWIAEDLVSRLMKAWSAKPESSEINAFRDVTPKGLKTYAAALEETMSEIAWKAHQQALAQVGESKLSDIFAMSNFDRLPKKVQRKLRAQSDLLVKTQGADLQKAVYFQFTSSVDASLGSAGLLEKDLADAAAKFVSSGGVATGALNTAAMVVNESRNAVFFDDKVLEGIESFTFTNGDPSSEICKDLDGRTAAVDDAESERYFPPLHHNCKSFLTPNLAGGRNNPEIDPRGFKPSSPDLEEFITLAEKEKPR